MHPFRFNFHPLEYQEHPFDGSGEWKLTDMADKTKLGTEERLMKKQAKLKQYTVTSASGKHRFVSRAMKNVCG